MGVRITGREGVSALYDSVSGFAFGIVFDNNEEADDFLEFAKNNEPRDLRVLLDTEFSRLYSKWSSSNYFDTPTPKGMGFSGTWCKACLKALSEPYLI